MYPHGPLLENILFESYGIIFLTDAHSKSAYSAEMDRGKA